MLDFVNMASTNCFENSNMSVLHASLFIFWYTLFVVWVVKSATSATYMQNIRSQHVSLKDDKTGWTIVALIPDPSKCHFIAFGHGSTNGTNGIPISFKVLPMVPLV